MLLNLHASPVLFYYLCQREIRCLCFYHGALSLAEHSFKLWILSLFFLIGRSKLTWREQSTTAGWRFSDTSTQPWVQQSRGRCHLCSCGSPYTAQCVTVGFCLRSTRPWFSSFAAVGGGSVTGAGATKFPRDRRLLGILCLNHDDLI